MANYRTIITQVGQTKLAAAIASGPVVNFTTMAVGDSNGVGYDPAEQQTALVNQVYSASLDSVELESGGVIVLEMTIPATSGGYHIREAAAIDDDGDMIAIVRLADRYKPLPSSGQADELTVRMKLDVGNVGAVTWDVDLAKKAKIDGQLRPDFRSVDSIQNTPPGSPIPGETWIVGLSPTGAWVGHENELAEWSGSGWTFAAPTPWMLVGLANRTDWRWDSTLGTPAWVPWVATGDVSGPIKLNDTLRLNQTFPEIETADNKLTVTSSAGGIVLTGTGETWIWRGHRRFSVGAFLLADRTMAHTANKTYHLRWHAPGTGTATPEATYPNGRFELADMAGLTETNSGYDTTHDRMLIARVVTDESNVATITALANKSFFTFEGEVFLLSGDNAWENDTSPIDWSAGTKIEVNTGRRVVAIYQGLSDMVDIASTDGSNEESAAFAVTKDRYELNVFASRSNAPGGRWVVYGAVG